MDYLCFVYNKNMIIYYPKFVHNKINFIVAKKKYKLTKIFKLS